MQFKFKILSTPTYGMRKTFFRTMSIDGRTSGYRRAYSFHRFQLIVNTGVAIV